MTNFSVAFFQGALHAALGIIQRPWFESLLVKHFEDPDAEDDPSFFALRNIVYATGCRIELAKHKSFAEANQSAWQLFENALSAHTEILYSRTSLMGVQALTLMVREEATSPIDVRLISNRRTLRRILVALAWNICSAQSHYVWLYPKVSTGSLSLHGGLRNTRDRTGILCSGLCTV